MLSYPEIHPTPIQLSSDSWPYYTCMLSLSPHHNYINFHNQINIAWDQGMIKKKRKRGETGFCLPHSKKREPFLHKGYLVPPIFPPTFPINRCTIPLHFSCFLAPKIDEKISFNPSSPNLNQNPKNLSLPKVTTTNFFPFHIFFLKVSHSLTLITQPFY